MCQCIVDHESGGNPNALNFNEDDSTYDIGVFQINTVNWHINSGNPPCNITQNLCVRFKFINTGAMHLSIGVLILSALINLAFQYC